MALFSGGRFIRATLRAAGLDFWKSVPSSKQYCIGNTNDADFPSLQPDKICKSPARLPFLCLSCNFNTGVHELDRTLLFFSFPDNQDGEDIKLEFKKRFAEVETQLTFREKEAIVQESQEIFRFLIELVKDLDRTVAQ